MKMVILRSRLARGTCLHPLIHLLGSSTPSYSTFLKMKIGIEWSKEKQVEEESGGVRES